MSNGTNNWTDRQWKHILSPIRLLMPFKNEFIYKKKIMLDIIERMFYNEKQKKPEVLSTKVQNFLDQLNIEFIDSERARGYF